LALVEGSTLEGNLRRQRVMAVDEVRWIITQAARALLHAHGKGVVHRDVKPANISGEEQPWSVSRIRTSRV